jgi:hypothetical protein
MFGSRTKKAPQPVAGKPGPDQAALRVKVLSQLDDTLKAQLQCDSARPERIENTAAPGKSTAMSGHKPSERFMRKPLQAKSRASRSERVRVADLVNKLVKKMDTETTDNAPTKFSGYKPGQSDPPG